MPRIPEATVQQIKARADVYEVVSEVVRLTKKGQNYFGLCPFHDEKTASFSVNPKRGIFHCFGCGKGGNAISFVMEYERVDYVEALKRLAEKYGIKIEWEGGGDSQSGDITLLYEMHSLAASYYEKQLFSAPGKNAREYLNKRGFDDKVLKRFSVGYATNYWDGLLKILDRKKFTPQLMEKSGLFIKKKSGQDYFDRFRNRIMFPIKNVSGRVVAFGGRTMDPEEKAKYMNSPETPIYNKSGILYGLDTAKDHIRKSDTAIIVEGYTDLIRFFSVGIENVAAGSGTALTNRHASLMNSYTKKVVLCYDGDSAGQKATVRAGFIFLKEGLDVQVIQLPAKDDPDSFLKNNDLSAFTKKLEESLDFIPFYINQNKKELKTPASKTLFIDNTLEEIAEIKNPITRDFVVKNLAEQLKINEGRILQQLRYFYKKRRHASKPDSEPKKTATKILIDSVSEKAEFELIKIIIAMDADSIKIIRENITPEHFTHKILKKIVEKLFTFMKDRKVFKPADLFDLEWTEGEKFYLSKLIQEAEPYREPKLSADLKILTIDCIIVLYKVQLDAEIKELRDNIRQMEKNGKDAVELVIKLSKKQKERRQIETGIRDSL